MEDEKIYNQTIKRVLMKSKLTFNYYYAYWDNAEREKYSVKDFCAKNRFAFNQIDCETEEGVQESIKHKVKTLPMVRVCAGNKELFRVNGKHLVDKICSNINEKD